MTIISFQQSFTKEIPANIHGNADYLEESEILRHISDLLIKSGIQDTAVELWLDRAERKSLDAGKQLGDKARRKIQAHAVQALRTMILRKHCKASYRELARLLSHSPLYQWFCCLNSFADVRIPSNSKLHNDENMFPKEFITQIDKDLVRYALGNGAELGFENPLDVSECYFDTFCLETNIHHPVDWVLLRDACRTLMLSVARIRSYGIVHRMPQTWQSFITKMNNLCTEMTQVSRNKKAGKKKRKKCFRSMKKLIKKVEKHTKNHLDKLEVEGCEHMIPAAVADQISKRMKNILDQLPEAIRQGNERVIGERNIANDEKILSLYEPDVNVVTRRKAGALVEFGNKASLMEQKDGIIVSWDLVRKGTPSDVKLCRKVYDSTRELYGPIDALSTDRGCASKQTSNHLEKYETYDATCPRNPQELAIRMQSDRFKNLQKRRAGTEARISILGNFTGDRLKCKGFDNRVQQFGICVLTHNLWKLARMMIEANTQKEKARQLKAS